MTTYRITSLALCATGLLALTGCGGSSSGSDGTSTGTLDLQITDAPVDGASAVVVQFDGVEIQPANGERLTFDFEEPRQIDLLALQGNNSEPLLTGEVVPAGDYEWIRLMVTTESQSLNSYIEMEGDGGQHALFIPSGAQTGLKLVSGFSVPVGGKADFTIDFDLRKSVVERGQSGQPYILKPTLRIVDNSQIGSISGTVDTATASSEGCSPAAYVYSGTGVTADEEGSETPPLTSAMISMDESTGEYGFTVGFLNEGDYTVAWTCFADQDEPETEEGTIIFEASVDATVVADQNTEVSFTAAE